MKKQQQQRDIQGECKGGGEKTKKTKKTMMVVSMCTILSGVIVDTWHGGQVKHGGKCWSETRKVKEMKNRYTGEVREI